MVLFQFLIGSLEAAISNGRLSKSGDMFQFLIGSLEAGEIVDMGNQKAQFQFLIGSLEAGEPSTGHYIGGRSFNSS